MPSEKTLCGRLKKLHSSFRLTSTRVSLLGRAAGKSSPQDDRWIRCADEMALRTIGKEDAKVVIGYDVSNSASSLAHDKIELTTATWQRE